MKTVAIALALTGIVFLLVASVVRGVDGDPPSAAELRDRLSRREVQPVDHSKFPSLNVRFGKPQEVTAACIACHNGRHREVMQSSHWNWERIEYIPGRGIRSVGKKNVLNNFCIGISGNEQSCNRCHVGYGYSDAGFDFSDSLNVDCLACHDNSGNYAKAAGGAGMPDPSVDLGEVARHVGLPRRSNCGTCHFFGGGGNNVKHGDLDRALFEPPRELDVHMASDGADMQCVDCHTAVNHQMLGKMYSVSSMNRDRVECSSCHTERPHGDDVLNRHAAKVACQSCHIPRYARANPTKLTWDWSTAGRLRDGRPYEEEDSSGNIVYASIKGTFTWGKDLRPEYIWFNGTASHYLVGDTIDPSLPVKINDLLGSYDDPVAKLVPVKVHRARQIYDSVNRYLIQPKTVSTVPGDGGYWREFDWQRSAGEGMRRIGLPYSGSYGFVNTEMTWTLNHMVAPAREAVRCDECHTRDGGRLAGVPGGYVPGRDVDPWVERFGGGLLALVVAGVAIHGGMRITVARNRKRG